LDGGTSGEKVTKKKGYPSGWVTIRKPRILVTCNFQGVENGFQPERVNPGGGLNTDQSRFRSGTEKKNDRLSEENEEGKGGHNKEFKPPGGVHRKPRWVVNQTSKK